MYDEEKKARERGQVSAAAAVMKQIWKLTDGEEPDFLVESQSETFGLEVTQCFTGKISKKKGAVSVKDTVFRKEKLSEIRSRCLKEFPEIEGWSLHYAGEWNDEVESRVRFAIDFARANADSTIFVPVSEVLNSSEPEFAIPDFVSIKKRPYAVVGDLWAYMGDSVGPTQESSAQIQDAINCKAKKLAKYNEKSKDVRLLIYCSSLRAVENVSIGHEFVPDLKGFNSVYFAHFPNYVAEFSRDANGGIECKVHSFTGRIPESFSKRYMANEIP